MSDNRSASNRDLTDTLFEFLQGVSRFLIGIGILAIVVGVGFLVYTVIGTANASAAINTQAISNVHVLSLVLEAGVLGFGVGSAFLWWGEEIVGPILLIVAALLYTTPYYIPTMVSQMSKAGTVAIKSIQDSGTILGLIAICAIVGDVGMRIRDRATLGAKKDVIKLGKGVKTDGPIQNKLMGSCWQLPFCRKYVREKCPIYHSRRTCWKEQVGCMCEEQIIGNALQGKVIPKDALAAAALIPRNNRLTPKQKFERCKSCVIYNEHQRHKYRVAVPAMIAVYALLYLTLRGVLSPDFQNMISHMGGLIHDLTYTKGKNMQAPTWLAEFLVVALFLLAFSYTMKIAEWLIFSAKL